LFDEETYFGHLGFYHFVGQNLIVLSYTLYPLYFLLLTSSPPPLLSLLPLPLVWAVSRGGSPAVSTIEATTHSSFAACTIVLQTSYSGNILSIPELDMNIILFSLSCDFTHFSYLFIYFIYISCYSCRLQPQGAVQCVRDEARVPHAVMVAGQGRGLSTTQA
jgi:hypothetical protein